MKPYSQLSKEELLLIHKDLEQQYKDAQALGLHLDMSRGKPCAEQLDISMGMMDVLSSQADLKDSEGIDCWKLSAHHGRMDQQEFSF